MAEQQEEKRIRTKLMLGDNIKSLKELPDNSVDSIVTDPPYALTSIKKRFGKQGSAPAQFGTDGAFQRASKGFMGKEWDAEVPTIEFWSEIYRVLKPGGHVLSFGGTRTYHRMAVNIEDAGFEIRDQIMWLYGSGFPKSHNIGKAVDKIEGNDREIIKSKGTYVSSGGQLLGENTRTERFETKGQSPYEGWGTSLKPANEPICVARKPLSEKSVAENVLKWGTGGINIDGCRIETKDNLNGGGYGGNNVGVATYALTDGRKTLPTNKLGKEDFTQPEGRFPANVILDEIAGELLDEQSGIKQSQKRKPEYNKPTEYTNTYTPKASDYRDDNTYNDKGGASRFFYQAKVSKAERNMGLNGFEEKETKITNQSKKCGICNKWELAASGEQYICECENPNWNTPLQKNIHPTVKPVRLMAYLCRLVTPPNGVILDPFMGSGSTGIAAQLEGFNFIGMELDQEYMNIAEARINNYEDYRKFL